MNKAFHVRVYGRVQGVGFRYSTQKAAAGFKVSGWVRNSHDGSVEVLCEGAEDAVARFLVWLEKGPPTASVYRLSKTPVPYKGIYRRFSIEY